MDTETTGLSGRDEIVQVAVIDSLGEVLLHSLVRPTRPIPAEVVRIHGITDADVRDAPTGAEVLRELAPLLASRLVCAYNADFDLRLLAQTARAWRVRLRPPASACVMKLYAEHAGVWDSRHRSYRWHSLTRAAQDCRLGLFRGHDALADAAMTLRLLRHIAGG